MNKWVLACLSVLSLMVAFGQDAHATVRTITCTGSSDQTLFVNAINASVDGDEIAVDPGTCAFSPSGVNATIKRIWIHGAAATGAGTTIITRTGGGIINAMMPSAGLDWSFRFSHFTVNVTTPGQLFTVGCGNCRDPVKGWRFDHLIINSSGTPSANAFVPTAISWGLIDHITYTADTPTQLSYFQGNLNGDIYETGTCSPQCYGYYYWNRDLNLGSDEAVYIEDSTFDNGPGSTNSIADVMDMGYGGSIVVRHNSFIGMFLQTHSTGHTGNQFGGMKYEIYNNTFNGDNEYRWAQIRSGTGVVFNNTVTGYQHNRFDIDDQRFQTLCEVNASPMLACSTTNSHDGGLEPCGWPCVSQIGRGAALGFDGTANTQTSVPLYAWNNGSLSTCASGGDCDNTVLITLNDACSATNFALSDYLKTPTSTHTNGQFDYVNNGSTAKPGYTPYIYPHPLQGLGNQPSKFKGASGSHRFTGGVRMQ